MKKIKIIFLIIFCLTLLSVVSKKVDAFTDTYLTSYTENYTYYTTESRWVSCRWIKIHDIYMCNNGWLRGGSGCNDCCGGIAYDYGYDDLRNSCTGAIICDNNGVPDPGGYWQSYQQAHTGSRTVTVCNYICGVTSWDTCSSHTQSATAVSYCQVKSSSCSRTAALTQYCNTIPVAQIITPAEGSTYDKSEEASFSGTASDPDGDAIAGYEWRDGSCTGGELLSTEASFSKSGFDPGVSHTIYFRAQDDQGEWSNCDQVTININPACVPDQAPAENAFCSGDTTGLSVNTAITRVDSPSDCTDGQKCEYYPFIVGSCGEAVNNTYCSKPTQNLCAAGTLSSVESDGDYWNWTCEGINAPNEDCQAQRSCAWKEVSPE